MHLRNKGHLSQWSFILSTRNEILSELFVLLSVLTMSGVCLDWLLLFASGRGEMVELSSMVLKEML